MQLWECCSESLRKLLTNLSITNSYGETELLVVVRWLAVKSHTGVVEQLKFFNLNQLDGENFLKYLSCLQAQSTACDFQVTCPAEGCGEEVSFVDKMVFFAAMKGMGSEEFHGKVLEKFVLQDEGLPGIVDLTKLVEAYESSADAQKQLGTSGASVNCMGQSEHKKVMDNKQLQNNTGGG